MAYDPSDDDAQTQLELARLLTLLDQKDARPRKQSVMDRYPPGTPGTLGPERSPNFRHATSGGSTTAEPEPNFSNVKSGTPWYDKLWDATKTVGRGAWSGELPLNPMSALISAGDIATKFIAGPTTPDTRPAADTEAPSAIPGAQAAAAAQRGRGGGGGRPGGGALPGAVSQAQTQMAQQQAAWDAYIAGLRKQRGEFDTQLEALNKPPDYTELQRQMRQRGGAGSDLMAAAAISGLGPAEMRGMQEHILKRAEGMQAPQKVEGGVITAEGEVQLDPMYQQLKKKELLEKRIEQLNKMEQSAISAQEKAEIARERIRSEERMDRLMAETRLMVANIAAASRQGSGGQHTGGLPKGASAKDRNLWSQAQSIVEIYPDIEAKVRNPANAKAFGWGPGAGQMLAAPFGGQGTSMPWVNLTDEQAQLRNQAFKGAVHERKELAGTAVTRPEQFFSSSVIPGPSSSAVEVANSMAANVEYAKAQLRALEKRYGLPPNPEYAPRRQGNDRRDPDNQYVSPR